MCSSWHIWGLTVFSVGRIWVGVSAENLGKWVGVKAVAGSLFLPLSSLRINRPDLLKMLGDLLLERIYLAEQEISGKHRDGKTEKTLQQMAIQQRGELGRFIQADFFSKPHDEQKLTWGQLAKTGEVAKVELKEASVQTVAKESDLLGFRHGGEKPPAAMFSTEPKPETWCRMPGQQAAPLSGPCVSHKVSLCRH